MVCCVWTTYDDVVVCERLCMKVWEYGDGYSVVVDVVVVVVGGGGGKIFMEWGMSWRKGFGGESRR